jgi:hypothetical protein
MPNVHAEEIAGLFVCVCVCVCDGREELVLELSASLFYFLIYLFLRPKYFSLYS